MYIFFLGICTNEYYWNMGNTSFLSKIIFVSGIREKKYCRHVENFLSYDPFKYFKPIKSNTDTVIILEIFNLLIFLSEWE